MKNPSINPDDSSRLRQRAEEKMMLKKSEINKIVSETEILKLIHELEVHQIELEIQNEELAFAKEKAELAEEKYTELYDFAPSGYFTLSRQGSIMEINFLGAKMLGKERSLLINSQFGFFVEEDSRIVFADFLDEIFRGQKRVNCDIPIISSYDISIYVHLTGIQSDNGEQCRITAIDITDRKVAEDDLLKVKEKSEHNEIELYKVQAITHVGNWYLNLKTNKVEWTEELYKMYGFDPALPPPPYTEHMKLFTTESWQILSTSLAKTSETGIPFELELKTIRKDKSNGWMWVRGEAIFDDMHKIIGLWGAAQDITERKQNEDQLRQAKEQSEESERQFRHLFENAADAIFIADEVTGIIIDVNQGAERLMQMQFDEIIGIHQSLLHPTVNAKYSIDTFQQHKELEDAIRLKTFLENKIVRKDGTEVPVEILATKVFYKGKNCLVGTFRDITERKLAQLLLQEKNEDIAAQNEELYNANQELIVAKEKAEESDEKYKALFYNAPLSYQSLDENGCFIDVNPMWLKTLGYERSEVIGKWYGDFLHPDFVEHFRVNFPAFKKRGSVSDVQFKMRKKDLTCIDVSFEGCIGYTPDGKFKQTYCVFKDITAQKALENELAENAERYRSLHNASFGGIAIHDKGIILECNQGLSEMTGYSMKELIGMDGMLFIAPQHREMVMNKIATGNEKSYEANGLRKNGEQFPMRLEARNVPYKGKNVRTTEFRDITESKQAEEEIKKAGQHYQALIEKAPDGIALIDANGNFKYISPSAKRMFGYNLLDEITGHPNDFTHPDDLPIVLSELEKIFKDPTYITTIEYRFIDKSGNWHWIETTFTNLLANPSVESIILNFRDITERKRNERKISLSEEKFRKAFFTSPDSININRLEDGMYISINKGFTQITGYTEEEVQKKTTVDINIWASDDERKKVNDEIKLKGYVENLEVKFRKKDGKLVDGLMSASIIELEDVPHILSITRDITERKQAETKLHQSEERYALVIKASEQGIWDWNAETNEVFYSSQWKKQIGYDDHELKNEFDTWIEHLHPDEKDYCLNAVESYLNHPVEHFILDFRFRHKDGTYRWIHNKAASIKNDEGKVIRLFGTHTDFTGSKLSESIINDIIEKNPMSIQILDMQGYPIQVNPAHTKLFGVEPPSDYSIFKDKQLLSLGFDKMFERIKKGETVFFPDSYYNVHDVNPSYPDSPAWVRALGFTLNDNNGEPGKIVLMHENITDRKNAEALLNDIIQNNPMSIQVVDKGGHTLRGNPAFIELFGSVPPSEFSIFDDLEGKNPEFGNLVSRVKNGEIVHLPDIYFNAHDAVAEAPDIPLWIRALIFPLKDSAGKPERFVFMHENITERKLYEAEIHKLNEELEQRVIDRTAQLEAANKELEAFSYSVSHDLRTPLRALNGFATFLIEDYSLVLDDEGKRLLKVISENATKMGCLIDDLLSFSRLGRVEMVLSPIQMKTMAELVYNELVSEADKDKIKFVLGSIPATLGDPSLVKQVWVNLIGNAIKFTSKKTDRRIEVGVIAGENENIYYVKDNGAGFEMANATKLFGVFQRLHTVKEFDGIGAGLAIVRRIILRHNGRVWAEGKVNEGATFYFTLPLNK